MLLHTSLWLQWLLCVTVALNWLIIHHILLIWHHLFSVPYNEKTHLAVKQFQTDDEVISAVKDFCEDQDEMFYTTGIQTLQHQCKKCVDHRGDYVGKLTTFGQSQPLHHCQPMNFLAHRHRSVCNFCVMYFLVLEVMHMYVLYIVQSEEVWVS